MTTGLFYLMLSPLPDRYSLDHRVLGIELKGPQLLGFWRRVLQVHMCFVYFIGGLAKCLGSGWWNGSNLWRSLTRPPFNLISPDILVRFKYALPILGISICVIELGYPFFIWIRKTRLFWLVCCSWGLRSHRRGCPPFHRLGLFALHGTAVITRPVLSPGCDHCVVSSPLRS